MLKVRGDIKGEGQGRKDELRVRSGRGGVRDERRDKIRCGQVEGVLDVKDRVELKVDK